MRHTFHLEYLCLQCALWMSPVSTRWGLKWFPSWSDHFGHPELWENVSNMIFPGLSKFELFHNSFQQLKFQAYIWWDTTLETMKPFCASCINPMGCSIGIHHQADAKLMARGIYGIGGILSVSEELRVLWSAPYLSRPLVWCSTCAEQLGHSRLSLDVWSCTHLCGRSDLQRVLHKRVIFWNFATAVLWNSWWVYT